MSIGTNADADSDGAVTYLLFIDTDQRGANTAKPRQMWPKNDCVL